MGHAIPAPFCVQLATARLGESLTTAEFLNMLIASLLTRFSYFRDISC